MYGGFRNVHQQKRCLSPFYALKYFRKTILFSLINEFLEISSTIFRELRDQRGGVTISAIEKPQINILLLVTFFCVICRSL